MEKHRKFPDLPDFMERGMTLREALAAWSEMMNSGINDSEYWWKAADAFARDHQAVH